MCLRVFRPRLCIPPGPPRAPDTTTTSRPPHHHLRRGRPSMSDYAAKNFNSSFYGLTSTAYILVGTGGICLAGFELLRSARRRHLARLNAPHRRSVGGGGKRDIQHDENHDGKPSADGGDDADDAEQWAAAHLYSPRQFHASKPIPAPRPHSAGSAPLVGWMVQTLLRVPATQLAATAGLDAALYVAFLRAATAWALLHSCTTAPVLLALHETYADPRVPHTDMARASIASIVLPPSGLSSSSSSASGAAGNASGDTCLSAPGSSSSSGTEAGSCDTSRITKGENLFFVHLLLLWYMSFTWILVLLFTGHRMLRMRKHLLRQTQDRLLSPLAVPSSAPSSATTTASAAAAAAFSSSAAGGSAQNLADPQFSIKPQPSDPLGAYCAHITPHERDLRAQQTNRACDPLHPFLSLTQAERNPTWAGWRTRTLMVKNLPLSLCDETRVQAWFERHLAHAKPAKQNAPQQAQAQASTDECDHHGTAAEGSGFCSSSLPSPVQEVVLVRKMGELHHLVQRQQDVRHELELCHVHLSQNVLSAVRTARAKELGRQHLPPNQNHQRDPGSDQEHVGTTSKRMEEEEDDTQLAQYLAAHLVTPASKGICPPAFSSLIPHDDHSNEADTEDPATTAQEGSSDTPLEEGDCSKPSDTFWDALFRAPRRLLDPHQPHMWVNLPQTIHRTDSHDDPVLHSTSTPTTKKGLGHYLLHRSTKTKVAQADYLVIKYNWLAKRIKDLRSTPPHKFPATSTAFVTFRDPRQARLVLRELAGQQQPSVHPAPEARDLDWPRLTRASFSAELVRGTGTKVFFWVLTLFWIFPLSIFTSVLANVETLKTVFPGVDQLFENFPRLQAWLSVTLPSVLVAVISMGVPEMIFQVSARAQGFLTRSDLYDVCLCRYWKFIMITNLLFFCVGVTALKTALIQIGNNHTSKLLTSIAFSFPSAAAFFVSYLMLTIGTQSGMALVQFLMGIVRFCSAIKAATPRARWNRSHPTAFYATQWLPQHLLIMAILFVFACLNPLVLPFGLVYLMVALYVNSLDLSKICLSFRFFCIRLPFRTQTRRTTSIMLV